MAAADIERILLDLARDTVSSIIDLGSTIYYDPLSEMHSFFANNAGMISDPCQMQDGLEQLPVELRGG